MSSGIPRLTALSTRLCRRNYATHAHASQFSVSQVNNGIKVVTSADEGKPISSISVVLKGGSRYEASPGMSHVLKNLVFKATEKRSALSLVREVEHLGGVLTSSYGREHLVLTAEFIRGHEDYFTELLGDVVSCSRLLPHEYAEEVVPQVASEYAQATQDPRVLAFDAAHQVAFRKGLGNSLFASPHTSISHDAAASHALSIFGQSSQMAVVATGVPHSSLSERVTEFFAPKTTANKVATEATQYHGGEVRIPFTGSDNRGHVLLAFKGAARSSSAAYVVLQELLGGQSSVKWTQGTSRFSSLSTASTDVHAFNVAYSDAGLFGIYMSGSPSQIQATAATALAELHKVAQAADEQEVQKAKAKAKFAAACALEAGPRHAEALGAQALDTGILSLEDTHRSLDAVTAAQVSNAAATALKSRLTSVVLGDTHRLPYADSFSL